LTPAACHGKEPAIHRSWESFMSKEKRGTKRLCESCENKYYDLGKTPIVCPVCETPFVEEKPKPKPKPKPKSKPKLKPKPKAAAPAAPAAEKAAEPAPAEKATVAEPAVAAASEPPPPDPEFVSLEEAAAEEDVDEDAKLADLGDDEVDIPPDENQDVFLEEDDDEAGSSVSGIIGGAPDTKDEA
jgi:uncharacterized protein (TIGR02300 family)